MARKQNSPGSETQGDKKGLNPRRVLHPIHEAAMRLADMGKAKSLLGSKELVSMLLTHGARAWRGSQPEAHIHIYITAPSGRNPVRLKLR